MTTIEKKKMTWSGIRTRVLPATSHLPARIAVTDSRHDIDTPPRRLVLPWDRDKMRDTDNHADAAQAWLDEYIAPEFDKCKPVLKPDGYVFGGDMFWSWDLVGIDE